MESKEKELSERISKMLAKYCAFESLLPIEDDDDYSQSREEYCKAYLSFLLDQLKAENLFDSYRLESTYDGSGCVQISFMKNGLLISSAYTVFLLEPSYLK